MLYFFLLVFSFIKFARFSRNLSVSCSWFKLSILQKICFIFFFLLHCFPSHACMPAQFSCVRLFMTLWTVAYQAPLSMGFSRQEYWSGLPCPSPGDLPNPGIEPTSLNAGELRDVGSIPGLGRSPGEGQGNPLQYSCLENPMDRGAW